MAVCSRHGTALHAAAVHGFPRTCEILLAHGADPNVQCGEYDSMPQALTTNERAKSACDAQMCSPELDGWTYGTALQTAAYMGHMDIVDLLLTSGADANAQAGIYGTALQATAYAGHIEIVNTLLDAGADFNLEGGVYGNSVQASVSMKYSKDGDPEVLPLKADILRVLIDKGADVNQKGGKYGCALAAARAWRHTTKPNYPWESPISQEERYPRGHEGLVEILLQSGATDM